MRRNVVVYKPKPIEATISLINIVFLMLIFFLVAGTLATQPPESVNPITLSSVEGTIPQDAVIIYEDGRIFYQGLFYAQAEIAVLFSEQDSVRLWVDRATPAAAIIGLSEAMSAQGVKEFLLVVVADVS